MTFRSVEHPTPTEQDWKTQQIRSWEICLCCGNLWQDHRKFICQSGCKFLDIPKPISWILVSKEK